MLKLSNLSPAVGSRKNRKRVGRGPGSGMGKTAGRGHKGQKSRSGGSIPPYFEGGQMPLHKRLPKRGFHSPNKIRYQVINLTALAKLQGSDITPQSLKRDGVIKSLTRPVKILGVGAIDRALNFKGVSVSKAAAEKISAAGGRLE